MIRVAGAVLQLALWAVLVSFLALVAIPRLTPFDVLVVRGGSMEPTIAVGSVLVIDRASRSPVEGTVTSFRQGDGTVVTHRVIAVLDDEYVTKGDANERPDLGRRTADEVLGTAVVAVPYAGFLIHVLRQPPVFLILLAGTGGFLILGELRNIAFEVGRMRRGPEAER
ncbi:MAG TPA: signal peptidase I [Candidatus Limnocylindrales bacterium]|nr:signal peptidase I [Candidatus Limnocylindrales bacterium]